MYLTISISVYLSIYLYPYPYLYLYISDSLTHAPPIPSQVTSRLINPISIYLYLSI